MADLGKMAPKINWDDLTQTAALPLGSWLKVDPWDDSVHMLDAKRYAPMNSRDKMPFEVTPVFYKLQRYETAHTDQPAAPAAGAPAANAAAPGAQGNGSAPASAPADGATPAQQPAAGDPTNAPMAQPAAGDTTATQAQPTTAPPSPQ
jgi:hypothetical protein